MTPHDRHRPATGLRNPLTAWLPPWSLRLWLTIALIAVCAIGGGSPRIDPLSLLYVRPLIAILLIALILVPGHADFTRVRVPMLLLGAFALTMVLQLIPLPPAIWLAMPGHAQFGAAADIAAIGQPWRPIALVPMGAWNALAALIPTLAGLVAIARLHAAERRVLLSAILAVVAVTTLVGTLQIASGSLYTYAVTSPGLPVGLFANRNHQAVFLAASLPMLAVWAHPSDRTGGFDRIRPWIALAMGFLVVVLLMVTGSRAGIGLGLLAAIAAMLLAPHPRVARRHRRVARIALVVLPIVAALVAILLGRALAVDRLLSLTGTNAEQRAQAWPTVLRMIRDFAPFGTGQGSFDPIYRVYEPDVALIRTTFNHAHNDLAELALTGGIAALVVLMAFVLWAARRTAALWARRGAMTAEVRLGWAGATTVAILLGGSIVDYPLRTPFLALVLALAAGWLATGVRQGGLSAPAAGAKPADVNV